MSEKNQQELGRTLWNIADTLRGAMNADDFRDYMLSFLFLYYLSYNYEQSVKKELGKDYTECEDEIKRLTEDKTKAYIIKYKKLNNNEKNVNVKDNGEVYKGEKLTPLIIWYVKNKENISKFEEQMRRTIHFVIKPHYLWNNVYELARTQSEELLINLQEGFNFIENESFGSTFGGLFSEINLDSEKLGKNYTARNKVLCLIISDIEKGLVGFNDNVDALGDAYEYLISQFAAGSGKKAGEFYTPQKLSTILSRIVTLDNQDPSIGKKKEIRKVLDFACGSGSLLINVRKELGAENVGQIYGQEKNITTYNLARMNMLLHGIKDSNFKIFHGDSLLNDWDTLSEENPSKKLEFDAVVANPPFSYRWEHTQELSEDFRFKSYGLAPKSAADFAFLLHGFHFLTDEGTMAIILPHGVLFRGGVEERIRTKLLRDANIDTVIGLPSNLFASTSIPVCILIVKKCKKTDNVLFIDASKDFEKAKKINNLRESDIDKIIETYKNRKEIKKYSHIATMEEIEENEYNLNIPRYVDTFEEEEQVDIEKEMENIKELEKNVLKIDKKINGFLKELGIKGV